MTFNHLKLAILLSFQPFGSEGFGFALIAPKLSRSSTRLFSSQYQITKRRNVKIPLLDITDEDSILPLPASHLPNELATLQIYGIQLQAGVHKLMITDTLSFVSAYSVQSNDTFAVRQEATYGNIVQKGEDGGLIGSIGCAAEIVVATPSGSMELQPLDSDLEIIGMGMGNNADAEGDFSGSVQRIISFHCKGGDTDISLSYCDCR